MKKVISSALFVILASFLVGISIKAADTDTITATVTAENISVTVSDGTISFGVLNLNTTSDTVGGETQTAENDGNVTEDFNIMGTDTTDWELADVLQGNGADRFRLQFSLDGSTWSEFEDDDYTPLTSNIPPTGGDSDTFDVEVQTPTSSSSYDEQSTTITVQAALHT
jgi:hypothetical protein